MLGLLVIIVISWGLIYLFEKKRIDVIGIIPNSKRIIQFIGGFLFIMIVGLLNIFIESIVLNIDWKLNSVINYNSIFNAIVYHFKSALTEDLIFRGAILYLLIQRIGAKSALVIAALAFGIYHVFSYEIAFHKIILVLYVVIITGFVGYVWSYIFYKTKSIYMGLGLHLGVNLINTFFFESQPFGELIFTAVSRAELSEWNNFLFLIFKGLFPTVLTFICFKVLYNNKIAFNQFVEQHEKIIK